MTAPASRRTGSQRFPRQYRLRKRPEFLALQNAGRRRRASHFIVITRAKEAPPSRLGITTSRKVGTAPQRNRVRRLVREFFRRHRARLQPPSDVLVIARPGAADLRSDELYRQLAGALGLEALDPSSGDGERP